MFGLDAPSLLPCLCSRSGRPTRASGRVLRPAHRHQRRCPASPRPQVLALIAATVYAGFQIDAAIHMPPTIASITEWSDTQVRPRCALLNGHAAQLLSPLRAARRA